MGREMHLYKAIYGYKKDGHSYTFVAYHMEHAQQVANEYLKEQNNGEPKSERLRLIDIIYLKKTV